MAAGSAAKRRTKQVKTARYPPHNGIDAIKASQKRGPQLALSATRRASERNLDSQIQVPINAMIAIVVMHMLSSPSSLSLAHLSTHLHLPQSLQSMIPSWLRSPSLAHFTSELTNGSERGSHHLQGFSDGSHLGAAGPFRSDARGFGHPLTALHNFTRAALGLSYPVPDADKSPIAAFKHQAYESLGHNAWAKKQEPWAFMSGVDGYVYGRGLKDVLIVVTMVLLFTALRAVLMKYVLLPLGKRCVPAVKEKPQSAGSPAESRLAIAKARRTRDKEVLRFAEQGYSLIYYVGSWSMDLYIASRESYWPMKTSEYWTNYPSATLDGLTKLYYLGELAFYIQQLFVLNVEARRSDHWQMFSHHVITIALIGGSYACSFHRVGNAILCLMDPSDICLALAKMLKYSGLQTICDVAFGIFMVSWLVTRHILYLLVMRSCLTEFSPDILASRGLSSGPYWTFIGLLGGLQVILMIWFGMIMRVCYRVLTKAGAVDSRSDDESSQEDGEEERSGAGELEDRGPRRTLPAATAESTEAIAEVVTTGRQATAVRRPGSSKGRRRG